MEMKNWSSKVKRVINEEGRGRNSINLAMVSANNHYTGFIYLIIPSIRQ